MNRVVPRVREYDDDEIAKMTRRMVIWNIGCAAIAFVVYIANQV